MKNAKTLVALALAIGGLMTTTPAMRAADDSKDTPPAKGKKGDMGERFKQMMEKLDLTDEQKEKIKPIMQAEAAKMKELRDDTSTDRQAKMSKLREIQQETTTKIKAILTPEQVEKYTKLQEARAKMKKKADQ